MQVSRSRGVLHESERERLSLTSPTMLKAKPRAATRPIVCSLRSQAAAVRCRDRSQKAGRAGRLGDGAAAAGCKGRALTGGA